MEVVNDIGDVCKGRVAACPESMWHEGGNIER